MKIRAALALLLAAAATIAACGEDGGTELPRGGERVELDPARFTANVDNRYWPLEPGTRWTYRETDADGRRLKVVVTATSETKKVAAGVTARVVRDTVTEDGRLAEDTFDWYAQDEEGNVWYMGERTAEFENGRLATTAGSFEAGARGAQAGIIMPAAARPGMAYRQEHLEGEAEDAAEVLSVRERAEVPFGRFADVLLTKDTNPLEPAVLEYKLYAPKVGLVLALGVSGGGGREELLRVEKVAAETASAAGRVALGRPYP